MTIGSTTYIFTVHTDLLCMQVKNIQGRIQVIIAKYKIALMRVDLTVVVKVKQKMKLPTNILQLVIKWLFRHPWEHWDRQF